MIIIFFLLIALATCKFFPFDIAEFQVKKILEKNHPRAISSTIENMLKTGRLATQTGLDLNQVWTCQCLVNTCDLCSQIFKNIKKVLFSI
jgi:hypothetical protein